MIKFIKKLVLISALLSVVFSVTVYAENTVSLTPGDEFSVFPEDTKAISETLNMQSDDISRYCTENNIVYLAVDGDNSRQIRVTVYTDNFSNSVVNISGLSNDKISALAEDITGIEGIRGEIINKGGQKFLKTQLRSNDSGGSYILTQFITVADRKNIILSFYNSEDFNIDYINDIFESYSSPLFITEKAEDSKALYYIIPIATLLLLTISLFLGFSIVKDLKNSKEDEYYYGEDEEETENEEKPDEG